MARSGYTLPVFAVAAAKAALLQLQSRQSLPTVELHLLPGITTIDIEQVAILDDESALAITRSDPGDNLDLTRNTPIWVLVRLVAEQPQPLVIEAGEGLGRTLAGEAAVYRYARELFDANLLALIPPHRTAIVRIILPAGRALAERTSNAAFGILEGLALLGTSGIAQPHSAADHLEAFRAELHQRLSHTTRLIFCIGSNGQQVAERLGLSSEAVVQTGNWIGALLVEAGLRGAESVLLLGYHGKLVKLAAGIFNTSSHIADGRLETLASAVVLAGGELATVRSVLACRTADAAHSLLVESGLAAPVFTLVAAKVSEKAGDYVRKYADRSLTVGTVLFDRQGQLIAQDAAGCALSAAYRQEY